MNPFERALADLPDLPAGAVARLRQHWELVLAWNARINLTSIEDDETAAWLHYRDSLEPLRFLPAEGPWADIGSGAGFPGVPLAVARPDIEITLVEPRRKRASFLATVKARLNLSNLRVLEARSEDPPDRLYTAVVTRATFSADAELRACLRWLAPSGQLIALRSADAPLPPGAERHVYELRGEPRALHILQA